MDQKEIKNVMMKKHEKFNDEKIMKNGSKINKKCNVEKNEKSNDEK